MSQSRQGSVCLRNLTIRYATATPVLTIPDLTLIGGGYTLVTGPTGSGKSSLALALVGVLEEMSDAQVSGQISLDGTSSASMTANERSRQIAAVWQRPDAQLFRRTILEEVRAGLDFHKVSAAEGNDRAREMLQKVGLSHLDESRDPLALSGGEQQRLALAAALVLQTPILVLDEVTSQLDGTSILFLREIIAAERARRRLTVIAFDHRPDPHLDHADRVIVLDRKGHICLDGTPVEVYVDGMRRCIDIGVRTPTEEVRVSTARSCAKNVPVTMMSAGHVLPATTHGQMIDDDVRSPTSHLHLPPTLSIKNLTVQKKSARLLDNVSLSLPYGAVALLLGPNGSGKTTLLNVLAGLQRRTQGNIYPSNRERRRRGIGYAPQRGGELMFARTVREELRLVLPPALRERANACDELLESVGLLRSADTHPQHLSGGQRQRLSALVAIANSPKLLLLDEPTHAQDAHGVAQLRALIADGSSERITVVATHDESVLQCIATHLITMHDGRLTEMRTL